MNRSEVSAGCLTRLWCLGCGAATVWVSLGVTITQIAEFRCVDKRSVRQSVRVYACACA